VFFDNREGIPKIVVYRIQMVCTSIAASSSYRILFIPKNIKISKSGSISNFLKLIVFKQIWIEFDIDGQFWADSTNMEGVDSMPSWEFGKLGKKNKIKNIITFEKRFKMSHVMSFWKAL
jgi:hypothetical protein